MVSVRLALVPALVFASTVAGVTGAGEENWPQWRGPGGQGISAETTLPTEWAPDRNIAWKTELPGSGHSSPIVWGDRLFATAVVEGEPIPGQKPVTHMVGGKEWVHPDSMAADLKHTFKLLALDAQSGKILWDRTAYEGPVFDARSAAAASRVRRP